MKATGIVRRIDDLGRVVIPKEIRRTLRLKEGTPLEIYTDREGEVILKKYSPMAELGSFAKQYADSMAGQLNCSVAICDRDQVIAAAGSLKKELLGQSLSHEVEQMMQDRDYTGKNGDFTQVYPVYRGDLADYTSQLIYPIVCEGDVIGAVVLVEREAKGKIGETEQKAAAMAASFLGSQMEG